MTDPVTKLLPFAVSVKAAPPAVAEVGPILVSPGPGLLTVKVCEFEMDKKGVGLETVMLAVPVVVILLEGTTAVSWVSLTNVVAKSVSFH
jgi:hypothetical protein